MTFFKFIYIPLGPSNTCTCSEELLKNRKNILLKYIAGNKQLELYALYGIQQLLTTLDHPIGEFLLCGNTFSLLY